MRVSLATVTVTPTALTANHGSVAIDADFSIHTVL